MTSKDKVKFMGEILGADIPMNFQLRELEKDVLQDLDRLEELEQENEDLKEELELLKKKYYDLKEQLSSGNL